MKRQITWLITTATAAMIAAPAFGQEASTATPENNLEDIIVTARRVSESSQKVPVAVTTLTASALSQRNIVATTDLQYNVPNLQIKPATTMSSTIEFVLRGQRQVLFTDENVVTYVNEVPQGTRGLLLYDLENVQTLKGPQGTLFGKNSMGGAMVFVTKRPTYDPGGELKVDFGNYGLVRTFGAVNIPLMEDVAALRLAGQIERRDGFYKNKLPGQKDLDNKDNSSFRATLLLEPGSRFKNVLTFDYTRRKELPLPAIIEASPLNASAFAGSLSLATQDAVRRQSQLGGGTASVSADGTLLMRNGNPYVVQAVTGLDQTVPGVPSAVTGVGSRVKAYGFSNVSTFELSDVFSLKNVLGYRYDFGNDHAEPDGVAGMPVNIGPALTCIFTGNAPGCASAPELIGTFSNNNVNFLERRKTFSEEFQLVGNLPNFKFITGLFYSHQKFLYASNSSFAFSNAPFGVGPVSFYDNPTTAAVEGGRVTYAFTKNTSYAAFAQGTYDFSGVGLEGLRLTAGVRYTIDKRDYFGQNFFTDSPAQIQRWGTGRPISNCNELNGTLGGVTGVNNGIECSISGKRNYKAPTWTASLEYQATPDTLIYLANRRGFKAGSQNPTTRSLEFAFSGSEKITDFELGLKHQGRLGSMPYRFNVAGFIGKYRDIQTQDILTFYVDSVNGPATPGTYTDLIVVNVGQATIKGVEVEAQVKPVPALTLDLGYSYQVGRYGKGSIIPLPADPTDFVWNGNPIDFSKGSNLAGKPFAGVPRTTLTAAFSYDADFIPESFAKTVLSMNLAYRSATPGSTPQGIYKTPAYTIIGGRLSFNDFLGTPMSLALWAQNIGDKTYKIYCADNLYSIAYAACRFGEPRTYGASIGVKF